MDPFRVKLPPGGIPQAQAAFAGNPSVFADFRKTQSSLRLTLKS